jgi:hypothetical protein
MRREQELFLGAEVDPGSGQRSGAELRLDPDRLTTHGVVFGMTGSGKTGLCVALLEELALAGVPVIIIDPKGDLANLALLFEGPEPADLAPWVDPGEAQRAGRTVAEEAAAQATAWQQGRAEWGLGRERVAALRRRLRLTVYTPGDDSGVPVNVLGAFAPPAAEVMADLAAVRELIAGTVSGLLSLVGVEADPVQDPEHVVLSRIVEEAWLRGEALSLATLIRRLIAPPFREVGVFPVDEFFPPDKRSRLAMRLNGVIAAPSFAPWTRGASLDLAALTRVEQGPGGEVAAVPLSLFYLAHLDDAERIFFAALLLERIVAWSRTLPGTGGLRALVYFDEVFGFLPPHPKDPPTKGPILTLLKQARAVGVGTVLVTQNPVDIDYKALSNAGLWLVGRLQTERDRERVMDGLLAAGGGLERK